MSNSVDSATTTEEINISTEEVKLVDLVKQEALNMLKEKITSEIGDKQVDKQLLMKLLVIGMETVEKTKVKGKDQKDIVIEALIQVIKLESVKVPHEEGLITFLENDVDNVIDLVVDASKGKLNINKAEKHAITLVQCLFSCLKKNEQN
jgi:hypothetical protein